MTSDSAGSLMPSNRIKDDASLRVAANPCTRGTFAGALSSRGRSVAGPMSHRVDSACGRDPSRAARCPLPAASYK
ncbi:MAG TPA: hypothetical protein VIL25_00375, partial [Vicinamibacterales bacterium]